MYLEQKLDPSSTLYSLVCFCEFEGVSAEELRSAVEATFRAHEAFRSVYREQDGELVRLITDDIPSVTIQTVPSVEEGYAVARQQIEAYDLSGGIPARAVIYSDGQSLLLALFCHHILYDGSSQNVFVKELLDRVCGNEPEQSSLDLSEIDAQAYQKAYERGLAVFEKMFANGIPADELPLKSARPNVHPLSDRNREFILDGAMMSALSAKAKENGVTVFTLLLGALAAVAAKYENTEEIVIGIPVNTRSAETKNTIGMFVNTSPLLLRPVRDQSTDAYIREVAGTLTACVKENTCPFDSLVAAFTKDRNAARNPLFDVGLNYLRQPAVMEKGAVRIKASHQLQPSGKDLNLVVERQGDSTLCTLQYSTELFEEAVVENFIEQFVFTLQQLCAAGNGTVADMLALPEDQAEELEAFSAAAFADVPVALLHRLFEQTAAENAEKTALIAKDRTLTYRELNGSANIVAHHLIDRGVKEGDSVALLLPRQSVFFSCLFGVNKAGAAFIPCDPQYPADRIRDILEDSGASYIITTEDKLGDYPSDQAIDVNELLDGTQTDNPEIDMNGDALAYMIYTSGSTGKPKGVMLRHKGICSYLTPHPANTHIHYLKNHINTYLSVTTVSFDMSFKEHTAALCNGKTLVFAGEDEMNDPRALAELMERYGVDCMNATPSRLQQYMEYEPFCAALARCKLVMSGGEGYPLSLRNAIRQCSRDITIINTYGPTEITVSCNAADLTDAAYVTVGKPLLNYREYIVDAYGYLAPYGVIGELYVGGEGVAEGYRNLPEKTAEAFVEYRGQRMYRTGDYAKFDKDGNVCILGRLDSQVKLRGLRIELGEIESLISTQPHIKKAAVVIRPLGGQDNLCAYFTADTEIDIDGLRDELKKHLTHYMVPAAFLQMEEMPVTANGKTDLKRLPELTAEPQETIPPQNEIQQRIFDIISAALGNSAFGIETDLYAAGLTSLNSVSLSIKLSDAFGVNVQIRDLRDNNTVQKLEGFIATLAADGGEDFPVLDEYAITKTQEGIFFETLSHPDTTIYNIPSLILLDDRVDLARLKQAIAAAVNAHPYLMTKPFINQNGEIRQKRVHDSFDLGEIDQTACASVEDVQRFIKPFDLQKEKLYRFKLIDIAGSHYLFFDIHHIVFDGESKKILLKDISAAYNGEALTEEKYSGYEAALAEERLRGSAHYDASKQYYTELLDGVESDCVPISDILSDTQPKDSGTLRMSGKERLLSAIKDYCAAHHVSENAFCTAAFGWLLGKYCGREDAVFTTINNGRNDPRFRNSVSMFVRTYPVYCQSDDQPIGEFVQKIGRQLSDSLSYDVYSFAEISRELGVTADVLFAYQSTMTDSRTFDFCGAAAQSVDLTFDEEKAKIELLIYPDGDRLTYHIAFAADCFTEDFIRDMIATYEQTLLEFTKKENTAQVQLVDDETAERLEQVNHFEHDYEITDIVTLFRRRAAQSPDSIAVVYLDRRYTYKEVDRLTENIAAFLKSKGVGTDQAVSVIIPRCEYMPIAALGVLKAGAGYQPLDPSYPSERLEFMIRDADAQYLIADRSLMDKLPNYDGPVLYTDEIPELPDAEQLPENPDPGDLFIMLYTSGSTGVPKGVMLEHRNLCCFCEWYITTYGMDENSRASAYASYGFDAHMLDMYPILISGGQLHIIDEEIRLDLIAIKDYFIKNGITHTFITTQVGRQYADLFPDASNPHHLSVGGEKLVPLEPPRGFDFYNGYGPTECTIFTHMYPVKTLYKRVPIGMPLFNMKQYIVDKHLNRLPFGMPGEMIVAGHQVGRGYLNRPEKNAEVFIRNPFSNEPGYEHAYRTGDIVRILRGGVADIIGRNDGQVKIRGFRIELSEVEGVIRKFPGMKDATVQAFDEPGGGKFIAAYVVSDEKVDVDALAAFIKQDKPAYMVPAVIMQIDRIPLNQNQKVNKRALPEPVKNSASADKQQIDRPMTRFEEEIAAIVKKLLGDVELSPTDDLTSCGLTSISAIGLVATLADRFKAEVSASMLLDGASIIDIENEIFRQWMEQGFADKAEPAEAIENSQPEDEYPLSSVQLAVYYDAMKNEADVVYNIPMCLRFDRLDADRLAAAVKATVAAHSYLNTHIEISGGTLCQVADPAYEPDVEILELTESELEAYKNAFIRPFDLHTGPLYRFAVVTCGDNTYLFSDIHHLIFDGMSVGVLLRDIGRAYSGETLAPEAYTCFDYAKDGEALKQTQAYADAEQYFDDLFSRYETPAAIPSDRSLAAEDGILAEAFCPVSKEAVDSFCLENKVLPSAFFLAAVFYTVSRFAGMQDVYLSTISSGRENLKLRDTIGMFVHTLPIAMHFTDDKNVLELIRASNRVMRDSIKNEAYPFAEIAAKYSYKTEIMYECQIGVVADGGEIGGNPYKNIRLTFEAPKFKTVFAVIEHDGNYGILVRYNNALYSKPFMQTLAASAANVVKGMLADAAAPVKTLSLLTDDEEQRLITLGQGERADVEIPLLHRVFEQRVKENPGQTALIACDRTLTYEELNREANRIAYSLMDRGVKRGDSIVLLLPRRSFYFAAMFGVLKTGAAFIPCDPEYPAERIRHIIGDAGARFIITTAEHVDSYPAEQTLLLDTLLENDRTDDPDVAMSGQDLAYMIYTSGSTGVPKGVMLRHEGICSYLLPHPANIHVRFLKEGVSRYLSVTTVSFDMSFKEHCGTLCNGKTLIFAAEDEMNDPRALAQLMQRHGVDCINATPSRLQQYMEYEPFREQLAACKVVMSGGEPYPMSLRDAIRSCSDSVRILNTYGPTEITVSSNVADLSDADHISVGRPLLNYNEFIVDADLNMVPRGVTGELLIGGPGVAKGYRNLPEQTQARFIDYRGERVYRSGDYAKWDDDGNVVILGRMDGQVKLRGLRIELGEIVGLMEQQPGIIRAAAAVRKIGGRENLCAWFTADTTIDLVTLREALAEKLTHYMVPAAMMQVTTIPVTPNGKTNLKALPDPEVLDSGEYVAPINEAEEFFCGLFQKVLGVEKVGATDDFFSIGGTSLAVTGVMIDATENGYELTYGDVFKYTTPRALASKFTGGDTKSLSAADFDLYDYSKINELLSRNTLESFRDGEERPIGNILLTGATGYMGIHVLAEFLQSQQGTVYCLVRKGRYDSALNRVKNMLFYYFGTQFKDIGNRLQAYDGDVTDYDTFRRLSDLPIDTVFNCAASVKHFSSGTDIEDINVGGVKNCIRFCLEKDIRLIHFSTTSVGGALPADGESHTLDEHILYYGQILENQYTSSKLLAEREVFESAAEKGLDAKVIRVGTLAPRESDGEFQVNFLSNSFMGRLRSYAMLKSFPYSLINNVARMGPIDESARAFMLLAQTPRACCLYNAVNTHSIPLVDVIRMMNEQGIEIAVTENEDFFDAMKQAEQDPDKAAILQSMLAYKNMNGKNVVPAGLSYEYTAQILARLGFCWNATDSDYIGRFIEALVGLGFFDENNLLR